MPSSAASPADTTRPAGQAEGGPEEGSGDSGVLPPLVVICGPTATGKTALALEVADRIGAIEIVSADSRQVYRGMDIGTAKVDAAARARIPHHGLDLVDPDEPFTAADFQRHATAALRGIAARGRAALLVGGTGLYLRVVARGVPVEESGHDAARRADLERRLARDGLLALAAVLQRDAPTIASRTDLANPRRVVRALERAAIHGDRPPPPPAGYPGHVLWLGLAPRPDDHAGWIASRARAQFEAGLVDEAAALLRRFPPDLRAFSAFGYREAFGVLDGTLSPADAVERTILRTRAYARRQRTWFRAEPGITWLEPGPSTTSEAAHLVGRFTEVSGGLGPPARRPLR